MVQHSPRKRGLTTHPTIPSRPTVAAPPAVSSPAGFPSRLRWRMHGGQTIDVARMETKHCYHAMKMCFNHLAARAGLELETIRFTKRYSMTGTLSDPKVLGWWIVAFILEIDRRGDLPQTLAVDYARIREQVIARCPNETLELLDAPDYNDAESQEPWDEPNPELPEGDDEEFEHYPGMREGW